MQLLPRFSRLPGFSFHRSRACYRSGLLSRLLTGREKGPRRLAFGTVSTIPATRISCQILTLSQ